MAFANCPILLGDSIFKRMLCQESELFHKESARFCVSGQRAADLKGLCIANRELLKGQKVIVLIGTNDVTKGCTFKQFTVVFKSLVRLLRALKCEISLCELLPLPCFGNHSTDCSVVLQINKYIRSFEPSGVRVVHSHDLFCYEGGVIKEHLYCKFIGHTRRVDLVHPNAGGLAVLAFTLVL